MNGTRSVGRSAPHGDPICLLLAVAARQRRYMAWYVPAPRHVIKRASLTCLGMLLAMFIVWEVEGQYGVRLRCHSAAFSLTTTQPTLCLNGGESANSVSPCCRLPKTKPNTAVADFLQVHLRFRANRQILAIGADHAQTLELRARNLCSLPELV